MFLIPTADSIAAGGGTLLKKKQQNPVKITSVKNNSCSVLEQLLYSVVAIQNKLTANTSPFTEAVLEVDVVHHKSTTPAVGWNQRQDKNMEMVTIVMKNISSSTLRTHFKPTSFPPETRNNMGKQVTKP